MHSSNPCDQIHDGLVNLSQTGGWCFCARDVPQLVFPQNYDVERYLLLSRTNVPVAD
jgi:hypothetical protein